MELSILWLRSMKTGKEFPIIQFSGDTDMATEGLCSLTCTHGNEVVVASLNANETPEEFERRVNAQLKRSDLRATKLVRVESETSSRSFSFQDFRKENKSPTQYYNDIYSVSGEAIVIEEITLREFKSRGG